MTGILGYAVEPNTLTINIKKKAYYYVYPSNSSTDVSIS